MLVDLAANDTVISNGCALRRRASASFTDVHLEMDLSGFSMPFLACKCTAIFADSDKMTVEQCQRHYDKFASCVIKSIIIYIQYAECKVFRIGFSWKK